MSTPKTKDKRTEKREELQIPVVMEATNIYEQT